MLYTLIVSMHESAEFISEFYCNCPTQNLWKNMCVITVPYVILYFGLMGKRHVIKRSSAIAFEQ